MDNMATSEENKSSSEENKTPEKSEKEKYFEALRSWLHNAQVFQHVNTTFPFYFYTRQMSQQETNNNVNNNRSFFTFLQNNNREQNDVTGGLQENEGLVYVIPQFWKRLLAEQVDFFILICIKLTLYYALREYLDFMDLGVFIDMDSLSKKLQEDYVFALELTSDLLMFEMLYRTIVCFYEAYFMYATLPGASRGATPGKALFGIKVITVTKIYPLHGRIRDTVIVRPGGDLTFSMALKRAMAKNALIAFLFPLFVITFFTKYSRTAYDVVCNVLVVEDNPNPPRRNIPT